MKTLYVHIGMAKTGSTAIQAFCKENAEILAKKGYAYPLFPFSYPGIASAHNGRFLWAPVKDENGQRDRAQEERNFKEGMEIVRKLFETHDNVILSDESIWRVMDGEKSNFWEVMKEEAGKGDYQLHAIVYLRRQDKFFASNWNQIVKKQWSKETFEQYTDRVDKSRLDYYDKLERLAGIIGKDNITVRRFDGGKFEGGSLYADFLMALGLSMTEEFHLSEEVRNVGLYGNTHEIKRVLNDLPQIRDRRMQVFILARLMEFSEISKEKYPSEMLSKEEIETFLETYGPGNRKVAEEYLNEPGAELFDNTIKDLPKWEKDNPYMLDDVIRFIGVTSIYLYQQNERIERELKQEIKEVKEELKQEIKDLKKDLKHPFKTFFRCIRNKNKK